METQFVPGWSIGVCLTLLALVWLWGLLDMADDELSDYLDRLDREIDEAEADREDKDQ